MIDPINSIGFIGIKAQAARKKISNFIQPPQSNFDFYLMKIAICLVR